MDSADRRGWDGLIPDVLGSIFSKLSLEDVLTVVPSVCKSWHKVVMGPYCWQSIDIEQWSDQQSHLDRIERMLRMLITRSNGSMTKLSVSRLQYDHLFSFIADNSRSLQILRLTRSKISDSIVEQLADRLSGLTFLDLSYCDKIGARALEAIGKQCKFLGGLCLNMHPIDVLGKPSQKDEARAIATTMTKLKHLELTYIHLDTTNVVEIISNCPNLEFIDLRGCWDVDLDNSWLKDEFSKLKVLGPHVADHLEIHCCWECEDSSYYSDSVYDYESWDEFDDDDGTLEIILYEGQGENSDNAWPQSP
ncbi:hypothetical protein DCAR_0521998 [Daucus carota subsp. sativus]|uniref:F-box domain-containing protein n=1 Tax=Daucus carota subsp. sativus TaxID=79200 RepID=A0A164ZIH2_DAUCS|nr:PREDICTED: F-box protein FBW2-like [Daucus carota subsp. sativus]WOH02609.1 hypothetical protein DCAR_0521998 [Daucus carota subsp. sativus]